MEITLTAGALGDVQSVGQAAEPMVSMDLIHKLTLLLSLQHR